MEKFRKAIGEYEYWRMLGNSPRILYNTKENKYLVALIIPFNAKTGDWQIVHQ